METLAPHAFNAILILVVAFLLKHELHDIKCRIVRMENMYFSKKLPSVKGQ